jgi:hypothetical protein
MREGCAVLLETTCFCAWDFPSPVLHITGFCRCRPGNC